jgi:hypothetical protein
MNIFCRRTLVLPRRPRIKRTVQLHNLPRMADFAVWGEAIARAIIAILDDIDDYFILMQIEIPAIHSITFFP